MKSLFLVLALSSSIFATELSSGAVLEVQQLIKAYGYTCDTVSNKPFFSSWDGSVTVACNGNRYFYELKDVGGNWTVKVK